MHATIDFEIFRPLHFGKFTGDFDARLRILLAFGLNINEALSTLDEREKNIIILRFGLLHSDPKSRDEIARSLNLSSERIRQIEGKAFRKLRYYLSVLEISDNARHD